MIYKPQDIKEGKRYKLVVGELYPIYVTVSYINREDNEIDYYLLNGKFVNQKLTWFAKYVTSEA